MVVREAPGHGLGWIVAAFFIVADMVGGGIVAMPVAFLETGLIVGIIFMHHFLALAIVIAMLCTVLAVLLIALGISFDISSCIPEAHYPKASISGAVVSLGTFLFAFSGHQVFPTIQHDMYRPIDFSKSIILGFCIVTFLYMPLSIYGYLTYGSSMHSSIIDSVQTPWIRHTANLTIAIHCILALIIMVNPLNQQAEHFFNAPHSFGIQRILIRTGVLVGALTNPPTCVVLPSLTNLYLNAMYIDEKIRDYKIPTFPEVIRRTATKKLLWNAFIIVIALVAGIVSAYLAIQEILTVHFTPPCYLRLLFAQSDAILHNEKINCCGMEENIYIFGNTTEMCQRSMQILSQ
uniref:Aa_trans domain-containing protein n=1 Tax=Wuchereria bancrofti TaxID=6293 RepID=A0A1I8ETR7_WUCBA